MSDQSLFDQTQTPAAPQEGGDQAPQANPLEELVGEGKKFKSVEDLAKGKLESDKFIEHLTKEQEQLRQDLEKYKGLEEKVEGLLKAQPPATPSTPATEQPTGQVDAPDINKLIEQQLSEREKAQLANDNFQKSQTAVLEAHGGDTAKAKAAIQKRAQELGVTPEYLGEQARQSPTAFATLMGLGQRKSPTDQPISSTHRSVPQDGAGPEPGTKAYFDKVRKENPQLYYSASFQKEVYKAAAANPDQWR